MSAPLPVWPEMDHAVPTRFVRCGSCRRYKPTIAFAPSDVDQTHPRCRACRRADYRRRHRVTRAAQRESVRP